MVKIFETEKLQRIDRSGALQTKIHTSNQNTVVSPLYFQQSFLASYADLDIIF